MIPPSEFRHLLSVSLYMKDMIHLIMLFISIGYIQAQQRDRIALELMSFFLVYPFNLLNYFF